MRVDKLKKILLTSMLPYVRGKCVYCLTALLAGHVKGQLETLEALLTVNDSLRLRLQ